MCSAYIIGRTSIILLFLFASVGVTNAQSRNNSSGTGGLNTIQGRIYLPSGKTSDLSISVRLESSSFPTLTVNADQNGGFSFRSLAPGNYVIVVEAGEAFEIARESLTIDTEIQVPSGRQATPKVMTIPIHLVSKSNIALKNEVIDARMANVPQKAIEHYEKGLALKAAQQDKALGEFIKARSLDPTFILPYIEVGKIFVEKGKLDDALQAFQTALSIDPKNFDAKLNFGIVLFGKGDFANAEIELAEAALLNQSAVTPHFYLGLLFIQRKNLDVAQKALETAKELSRDNVFPLVHRYLGGVYMAKNLNKLAVQELESYVSLAPDAKDVKRIRKTIADLKEKIN